MSPRPLALLPLLGLLPVAGAGCAAFKSTSTVAPFAGTTVLEARQKELLAKADVASQCRSPTPEPDKGGIVEVTAHADGKVSARSMMWRGAEAMATCVVDAANKITLTPLPSPSISTLWTFGQAPPPPNLDDPSVRGPLGDLNRIRMAAYGASQDGRRS